jgi:XapX domain-containing protein
MKVSLGQLLALAIGVASRLASNPLPAPRILIGAHLVLPMTLGYVVTDRFAAHREAQAKSLCGGPLGEPKEMRS